MTLINDSERYGGSAQVFKALTGGDNLRYEEKMKNIGEPFVYMGICLLYTSPSPRDLSTSRMPSSA